MKIYDVQIILLAASWFGKLSTKLGYNYIVNNIIHGSDAICSWDILNTFLEMCVVWLFESICVVYWKLS